MNERREDVIRQDGFIIGVAALSLLNGMHQSPFFDAAFVLLAPFFKASFFISSNLLLFYFTSLTLSAATLILAGAPAAIFEKLTGRVRSDPTSMGIWMAGCFTLALPTLMAMAGVWR